MAEEKTIIEAIHEKFGDVDLPTEGPVVFVHVPKSAPGKKSDGSIQLSQDLVLCNLGITKAGLKRDISNLCSHIVSLDLEDNKIKDLNEVLQILTETPFCRFLNLRGNPLDSVTIDHLPGRFEQITNLVLNEVELPWFSIHKVLQIFPNVSELHLSKVGLKEVCIGDALVYPCVKVLHWANNFLSDWSEVRKLGQLFPNLESLNLLQNPICEFPLQKRLGEDFKCLAFINLSETKLAKWSELEQFRYFPSLTHLKILDVPLFENCSDELRHTFTLSYLPNLTILNSGQLTETEKVDAERAFIRYYQDQKHKPERFCELHEIYGRLDPLADVDLGTSSYFEASVTVCYNNKTTLHSVHRLWTLQQLRINLQQWYKIPKEQRFSVLHRASKIPEADACILRNPKRNLTHLGVDEGDELYIELRN